MHTMHPQIVLIGVRFSQNVLHLVSWCCPSRLSALARHHRLQQRTCQVNARHMFALICRGAIHSQDLITLWAVL